MSIRAGLACCVAAALSGCGTPASTASQSSAIQVLDNATFTQSNLTAVMGFLNVRGSQVQFQDGTVSFTPSTEVSQLVWHDGDPSHHALSFKTPIIDLSPPWPKPDLHIWVTSLNVDMANDFQVSFAANELDIDVVVSGSLHVAVDGPLPDADLVVDRTPVHIALAFDAQTQLFTPTVTVHIQDHIDNCGIFDWCDSIYDDYLPNMDGQTKQAIEQKLTPYLADPQVKVALYNLVTSTWNLAHQGDYNGGPPWAALDNSLVLANGEFEFKVKRAFVPSLAPSCQVAGGVNSVRFFCQDYPKQHSGGSAIESTPTLHAQVGSDLTGWTELGDLDPVYTSFPFAPGTYQFRVQWYDNEGQGPWTAYSATALKAPSCASLCLNKCGTFEGCTCKPCACPPCAPPGHLHKDPDGTCTCEF